MFYTVPFCCDRHDDGFNLQDFLPAALYSVTEEAASAKTGQPRTIIRVKSKRVELEKQVIKWLNSKVAAEEYSRPSYEILSANKMRDLLRLPSKNIVSANYIATSLGENQEWRDAYAGELYHLIYEFDLEIKTSAIDEIRGA